MRWLKVTLIAIHCMIGLLATAEARTMRNSLTGNPLDEKRNSTGKSPSRFDYNTLTSYSLRQDLAQPREPKSALHRLHASGTVTVFDRPVTVGLDDELATEIVTIAVLVAGQASSIGNEIDATKGNGPVEFADLDASLSRSFGLNSVFGARSSIEATVGVSLPTSLAAQYEGYASVPYTALTWALQFQGGRYGLLQTLSADYVANTYDYSPVSKEINSLGSAGYSIAGTIRLGRGFRFRLGGNARIVNYLDGTNTSALANTQTLSWTDAKYSIALAHTNGSRAEDRETTLWFVDEYRRVISMTLSVRF